MGSNTAQEQKREDRREIILNELRHNFFSNMNYIGYLETCGKNKKELFEYGNIARLKAIYSSFMMMLWKDEFIIKDDDDKIVSTLSNELLDRIVSYIADKQRDDLWKIGEIEFNSNYDVIETIKNKLAHGDYIVVNQYLRFDIDGKIGYIDVEDIVNFTNEMASGWERISAHGENKQVFMCINPERKMPKKISNEKDLLKAVKNLMYIELVDKPKIGYERNQKYTNIVESFTKEFYDKMNRADSSFLQLPLKYEMIFQELGIELEYKFTPVHMLPEIDKVIKEKSKDTAFLKEDNIEEKIKDLASFIYEKYNPHAAKQNITEGLFLNQSILRELEKNKRQSFEEVITKARLVDLPVKNMLDKCILTSYLTGFYATYVYGLDKIYTDDERNNISGIYDDKMFDFSKLDLDPIYFDVLVIKNVNKEFKEQYNKDEKKKDKIQAKYFTVSDNYRKTKKDLEKTDITPEEKEKTEKALERQKKMLLDINKEYQKMQQKTNFEKDFINNKLNSYSENRAIIEHLRNSISHGNVELKHIDDKEKKIHFVDYDKNNRPSFETTISIENFNKLLSGHNLRAITEYMDNNIEKYNSINNTNTIIKNPKIIKF